MPSRRRTLLALVAAFAGAACGLGVAGSMDSRRDGGPDAPDGASLSEAGLDPEGGPEPDGGSEDGAVVEAGLDASQTNCLAACDGGRCDAGWCTFDCVGANACQNEGVVCPPGIPCHARCQGSSACAAGVDCSAATACRVECTGSGACGNLGVQCSGLMCDVDCVGAGACAAGVTCDAGACAIACEWDDACGNDPVVCNANTCAVRCGTGIDDSRGACAAGVTCRAATSCDVACTSRDTCRNQPVSATSGGTADVRCTARDTCRAGVVVSAGDGGITCGGHDSACIGAPLHCDGGRCTGICDGTSPTLCCASASCAVVQNDCTFSDGGC
jgi:hypothetical protein